MSFFLTGVAPRRWALGVWLLIVLPNTLLMVLDPTYEWFVGLGGWAKTIAISLGLFLAGGHMFAAVLFEKKFPLLAVWSVGVAFAMLVWFGITANSLTNLDPELFSYSQTIRGEFLGIFLPFVYSATYVVGVLFVTRKVETGVFVFWAMYFIAGWNAYYLGLDTALAYHLLWQLALVIPFWKITRPR